MNKWVKWAGPTFVGLSVLVVAFFLYQYLEQRPWPPEITSSGKTLTAGDLFTIEWESPGGNPVPEFYNLLESTDPSFSSSTTHKIPHKAGQTKYASSPMVAPAVPAGGKVYYYRVYAGYMSKKFSGKPILSKASNDISFTIKPLPAPSMVGGATTVFSGQTYTIGFTVVSKANAYKLEEKDPDGKVTTHKIYATSKSITAPPLKADGKYVYRAKAGYASGSSWTDITGWSNSQTITVTHVDPPPNLKVVPSSVTGAQSYTVSWIMPPKGPKPTNAYKYRVRVTKPGKAPVTLPDQNTTAYSATSSKVTKTQTIAYEVMALYGTNAMTLYSPKVTLTVKPPPPPPAPVISSVTPAMAQKGDTVTVTGKNLTGAKLELYSASTNKSVVVTAASHTASKITFIVPTKASLKTTAVQVTVGSQTTPKPFQVTRKAGAFVARQSTVQLVGQTCGSFKAEVDPPNYLNNYPGRFKEGSKVLVNISAPGFKGTNAIKSGLGFSKSCHVGIQVAESKGGIAQPFYILFYNLNHKQDSKFSPGDKIRGPDGIEASAFFKEGYQVLFSPDETLAAVISRNKLGPSKLWIVVTDMLTGKLLHSGGFNGPTYSLSVSKTNAVAFKPGSASTKTIKIPFP